MKCSYFLRIHLPLYHFFSQHATISPLRLGCLSWLRMQYDTVSSPAGTKLFSSAPQFSDLEVTELWVDGLVDGVNVTSLLSRQAARVNTSQSAPG